jgi:acyl-CoA thioester hydrolase
VPNAISFEVQTRFADLDALGHVNHVRFFTYMETARVVFLQARAGTLRGHVLVVSSECHHRHEISAAVRGVTVEVSVERVGRTSFTILHELRSAGTHFATGRITLVAVGPDMRPRPITDAERAGLVGQPGSA